MIESAAATVTVALDVTKSSIELAAVRATSSSTSGPFPKEAALAATARFSVRPASHGHSQTPMRSSVLSRMYSDHDRM